MKSRLLAALSLMLLAGGVRAQNVASLSLQQAVDLARKNNYMLQNARLDQQIASQKTREILSAGYPQINAAASINDYIDIPTQVVDAAGFASLSPTPVSIPKNKYFSALQFGLPYSAVGTISASQLIYDGTFVLGVKASREYVRLAKLGTARTETEIAAGVTKMYYAALITKSNVSMLDNTIATLEKTLHDQRAYYKNGLIEKIDIDRLELGYSNTQIQRDKIMDQYALALLALKLQLGINVTDSIVLTDDLEKLYTSGMMSPVDNAIDFKKRSDYQFLDQQMRLQEYDIKRWKWAFGPSLNATFVHQRTSYGSELSQLGTVLPSIPASASPITQAWFPTTILGVNLSLPVFDGFRKSSQLQQSRLTMMKFENDRKNLENTIQNEVKQSQLKFDRARQQLDIQKKNMMLAQAIYDRANVKYKNGVGSSLELSTAETDLKQAQTNYLGSLYDMLVAQTDLKKALGLLN